MAVGLRYMSISILSGCRIGSRSRKLMLFFVRVFFNNTVLAISGVPRGGLECSNPPPRNSEDIVGVLDRMSKNRRLDFLLQFTVFSYGVIY